VSHDLKPIIAARLRAARKSRDMTQAQLADEVSRTVEAISNIERGLSLPPLDLLQRVAEVLEVPLVDLIEVPAVAGAAGERSVLEMEIRSAASTLPIEHLRTAASQIAALAELAGAG
jgi:transcriptional regulator with XRE-family HTH domain